jgi:hypothetical protein
MATTHPGSSTPPTVAGPPRVHTVVDSPVGPLHLIAEDGVLCRLSMQDQRHAPAPDALGTRDHEALADVRAQLDAYFAGELRDFDLPLRLEGTPFQRVSGRPCARSPTGRRSPTASLPSASARRAPAGPSGWPTAATRSRSSSPATGSSPPTGPWVATAAAWTASAGSWTSSR